MNTDIVEKTAFEAIKERYPFLVDDNFKIEAHEVSNHIAFGGIHHDTYGWLELRGVVIIATAFLQSGIKMTEEFSNLKDACLFCIRKRFGFKY